MKMIFLIQVFLFSCLTSAAVDNRVESVINDKVFKFDHTHEIFQDFFRLGLNYPRKEKDDRLRYNFYAWSKNEVLLNSYINYLNELSIKDYIKFSKREKIIFLVNMYNAHMIKLILDKMPIGNIREINIAGSAFYSEKNIIFLGGKTSFMDLEDKILKLSDDYLPLFGLYRGSYSSPYIKDILTKKNYDNFLRENFKNFILRDNKIFKSSKIIYINRLFLWNSKKMKEKGFSLENELKKNKTGYDLDFKIKYLQYNWDINAYWFDDSILTKP